MSASILVLAHAALASNAAAGAIFLKNEGIVTWSDDDTIEVDAQLDAAKEAREQLAAMQALTMEECAAKARVLLDDINDGLSLDEALAVSLARDLLALAG